jgi:hypothetical protein
MPLTRRANTQTTAALAPKAMPSIAVIASSIVT